MASLLVVFIAHFCFGQEPLIEVIGRKEKLHRTQDYWAVVETLESQFRDSSDLLTLSGNLSFSGGTNRVRFFQIRGVGEISQYENTPTHSITHRIQGVDVTGLLGHWPILDVKEWSVQKNISSVQYGGQAIGGVIETRLRDEKEMSHARVSLDSRMGYSAGINVPIQGLMRLSLHTVQHPGFVKNTFLNQGGDARREYYASLTSRLFSSEKMVLKGALLLTNFSNQYDIWSLDNDRRTLSDRPGNDDLNLWGGSLEGEYILSQNWKWTSWTSGVLSRSIYSYDADWGNGNYWLNTPGWNTNYDYYDEFLRFRRQFQQKVALHFKGSAFGLHFQNLSEDADSNSYKNGLQRSAVVSHFQQVAVALYNENHWNWSEDLSFQASWRIESLRTQFEDSRLLKEVWSSPGFAGEIGLLHNDHGRWLRNLTFSNGYKSPILNIDPDTPQAFRRVGQERALQVDLTQEYVANNWNIKTAVFGRRGLRQQVRVSQQNDLNDPSAFVYFYDNAARTRSYGGELTTTYKAEFGGQAILSLGLLNAKFNDYIYQGQTLSGRDVAYAPQFTWSFLWSQPIARKIFITTQFEGRDRFYYSNNHNQRSSPYALAHAAVRYVAGGFEVDFGVRNIFNKSYGVRAFYFANEPPDFFEKLYVQNGLPQFSYVNLRWSH
jgi:iron complex outermembrane recepter protein